MKDIKIAFFDIDGTLVDMGRKEISQKTLEMLRKLREREVLLCLATGRSPMVLPHFRDIEFDVFLTFNGSYCYNAGEMIFSNPIPTEEIKRLIKNAAAIGRPVYNEKKSRLAANGTDRDLEDYFEIAGLKVEVADDFDMLSEGEIYQIMLGLYESEYANMMKGIRHAKIAAWWDRAADIIPADGGKGVAVGKILEYYHLDRAEAIAFGDGNNDIEMLQSVGTGVAMGNGSKQLKAVADDVCGHVAEDGIYEYCLEHGLIE